MKRGARLLILLLLAALLSMAAAFWEFASQEPAPLAIRTLPDSRVLRLEAVEYGRQVSFSAGSRWQRWCAHAAAFPFLGRWEGPTFFGPPLSQDAIIFWVSRTPGPSPATRSSVAVLVDDDGCQFPMAGYPVHAFHPGSPWPWEMEHWSASVFPRRGKRLRLRIDQDMGPGRPVVTTELVAPNPLLGPYPNWRPATLPERRQDGAVTFTLTSLSSGPRAVPPDLLPQRAGMKAWVQARFRVTQRGRPSRDWEPVGLTLEDATGNRIERGATLQGESGGDECLSFARTLCPAEPAWKLRVQFARVTHVRWAPGDCWTRRGVPVPGRNGMQILNQRFTWNGRSASLLDLMGPGAGMPGGEAGWTALTRVHFATAGWPADEPVRLVRAQDERGREVAVAATGFVGHPSGSGIYSFHLRAPPGARSLDLTFATLKPRFVEFVVKPPGR